MLPKQRLLIYHVANDLATGFFSFSHHRVSRGDKRYLIMSTHTSPFLQPNKHRQPRAFSQHNTNHLSHAQDFVHVHGKHTKKDLFPFKEQVFL